MLAVKCVVFLYFHSLTCCVKVQDLVLMGSREYFKVQGLSNLLDWVGIISVLVMVCCYFVLGGIVPAADEFSTFPICATMVT